MNEQSSQEAPLQVGRRVLEAEAAAVADVALNLGDAFVGAAELLARDAPLRIVSGLGKSGIIARKIAATLTSLGLPAAHLHPVEAIHGDSGMLPIVGAFVAISHSGETKELIEALSVAKRQRVPIISLTRSTDCTIAETATYALETRVVMEADPLGVAPSSSTTATLALGDALAFAARALAGKDLDDFRRWHSGGALGQELNGSD